MIHRHLRWVPLLALVLVAATGCGADTTTKKSSSTSTSERVAATTERTTKLAYDGKDGTTALELLRTKAKVRTEKSSLGEYVTSIDGTAATKTSYWMFYVDGKPATKGADAYETRTGERIEWRYES